MKILTTLLFVFAAFGNTFSQDIEVDEFDTDLGPLKISFIGHGSLMMEWDGKIMHIDPAGREGDYSTFPDADLVLITHHHGDHCDPEAVSEISTENTTIILTKLASEQVPGGKILNNDEQMTVGNFTIYAIPAYNLVHKRDNGEVFHPKGCCNSYVIEGGGKRIFIGGDTENTPEMKALENIDIAFLPMNLPYTMTPEMVADAALGFKPDILYPYHYGETDPQELVKLLSDDSDIEIRIRQMQ